jgi:hypothetical protein
MGYSMIKKTRTFKEFLESLSDRELEGLRRFLGVPEEVIEATRYKPDTRSDFERLRDRWDDPQQASRLTRAGFDREGMLRCWKEHEER